MAIYNTQFKRDAVGFMSTYAIAMSYGGHGPGVRNFVFERNDVNDPMMLRDAQPIDADTFSAYWLPYSDNAAFSLTLGSAADYMFTPPMTGCSFFLGDKWWSPEVAHINFQTAVGDIDQPRIDAHPDAMRIVANGYSLKKANYVPTGEDAREHRTIVFGVRGKLGWYLYRTKHDHVGQVVQQVPTRIN